MFSSTIIANESVQYDNSPTTIIVPIVQPGITYSGWTIKGALDGTVYSIADIKTHKIQINTTYVAKFVSDGPAITPIKLETMSSVLVNSGDWANENVKQFIKVESGVKLQSVSVTGPNGYTNDALSGSTDLPLTTLFDNISVNGMYSVKAVDNSGKDTSLQIEIKALDFTKPTIDAQAGALNDLVLNKANWSTALKYEDLKGLEAPGEYTASGIKSGTEEIMVYAAGTFANLPIGVDYPEDVQAPIVTPTPIDSGKMDDVLARITTGEYDVVFKVSDNAKNIGRNRGEGITLSNGNVNLAVNVSYDPTSWTNGDVTASYQIVTNGIISEVKVNNSAVTLNNDNGGAVNFTQNGTQPIYVKTRDESETTVDVAVTWIDKLAPIVTFKADAIKIDATIVESIVDAPEDGANGSSGIASSQYTLIPETGGTTIVKDTLAAAMANATPGIKYRLEVKATDNAGNEKIESIGPLLYGNEKPFSIRFQSGEVGLANLTAKGNLLYTPSAKLSKIELTDLSNNVKHAWTSINSTANTIALLRLGEANISAVGYYNLVFYSENNEILEFEIYIKSLLR